METYNPHTRVRNAYWSAIAVVAWHLLGGCAVDASYDGTAFRCDESASCPSGYDCVDGVCVQPTSERPDATVADTTTADAAPPALDAATAPPDAAQAIDAATADPDARPSPIQTLSFGDNTDDDVRGVTADTTLEAEFADDNFGAHGALKMDGEPYQVALLRFDVSAIPAGSDILQARLVVWTNGDPLQVGSVQVFRVLEPWDEGDASGSPGTSNYHLRKPATAWTTGGAGPGSRDTALLADFVPDEVHTRYETALATAPVQTWVDVPALNYGIVLATSPGTPRGCEFRSSESDELLRRPRLVVTFRTRSD